MSYQASPRGGRAERLSYSAPEPEKESQGTEATPLWTIRRAWLLVFVVGIIDLVWCRAVGLTFSGWGSVGLTLGFLEAVALIYGYAERSPRLGEIGNYAALWVAFSVVGTILTYLVATLNFPLRDSELGAIDSALGFHWLALYNFATAHWISKLVFSLAYNAMLPQIVLSIMYLGHTEQTERNRDFLWTSMFALILTTIISGVVPAVGPHVAGQLPVWSQMLMTIREGHQTSFSLGTMQGIIAFPSFHTVLAILLVYAHRPPSRSFWPVLLVNILMLMAVSPVGHHYLIDAISGAVIALLSIAIVRAGVTSTTLSPQLHSVSSKGALT
jgi:hypothetical protein